MTQPNPTMTADAADWKSLAREAAPVIWWLAQIILMLYALQHVTLGGAVTIIGVCLIWRYISASADRVLS